MLLQVADDLIYPALVLFIRIGILNRHMQADELAVRVTEQIVFGGIGVYDRPCFIG
jgi:hypothetical protein